MHRHVRVRECPRRLGAIPERARRRCIRRRTRSRSARTASTKRTFFCVAWEFRSPAICGRVVAVAKSWITAVAKISLPVGASRRGGSATTVKARWVLRDAGRCRRARGMSLGAAQLMRRRAHSRSSVSCRSSPCAAKTGDTRFWPLVENEHRGGVLRSIGARRAKPGRRSFRSRAEGVCDQSSVGTESYVGVLAIELFMPKSGDAHRQRDGAARS